MVVKRYKAGFSLVEALIVILTLSIFFAASAKIISKKKPVEYASYEHGEYTCWQYGYNKYKEQYRLEGITTNPSEVNGCNFKPRLNASIYHVYLFFPNKYQLDTVTNITKDLEIKINYSGISINNKSYFNGNQDLNDDIIEALGSMYPIPDFFDAIENNKKGVLISW